VTQLDLCQKTLPKDQHLYRWSPTVSSERVANTNGVVHDRVILEVVYHLKGYLQYKSLLGAVMRESHSADRRIMYSPKVCRDISMANKGKLVYDPSAAAYWYEDTGNSKYLMFSGDDHGMINPWRKRDVKLLRRLPRKSLATAFTDRIQVPSFLMTFKNRHKSAGVLRQTSEAVTWYNEALGRSVSASNSMDLARITDACDLEYSSDRVAWPFEYVHGEGVVAVSTKDCILTDGFWRRCVKLETNKTHIGIEL